MSKQTRNNKIPAWLSVLIVLMLVVGLKLKEDQPLVSDKTTQNILGQLQTNQTVLSAVPEDLRENVFLNQKENGCCKSFVGNIALSVVLVSDSVGQWDAESVENLKTMLDECKQQILTDAADYNQSINLTIHYYNATLTGDVCGVDYLDGWDNPALESAGLPQLSTLHKHLTEKYDAKEAPVMFAFNKPGRAYARSGSDEYFTVFSCDDADTVQHEMSHVFGAKDFYYPKEAKTSAEKYFPDSIMNAGGKADSFTAYLIGWTDVVSEDALHFLRDTKALTAEYINEANKNETFTGNTTIAFETGVYTGDLLRGVCHGTGTMQYDNGGYYTGQWENGTWSGIGSGKIIHDDGSVYEGEYRNGMRHGQGTYTFADGTVYTGTWAEGKMNGAGKETYTNGGWCIGNWKDGELTGEAQAKLYYANGVYEGTLYDGERHGFGTFRWDNGNQYSGQWTHGEITGYGTYTHASGVTSTGKFENGKFVG